MLSKYLSLYNTLNNNKIPKYIGIYIFLLLSIPTYLYWELNIDNIIYMVGKYQFYYFLMFNNKSCNSNFVIFNKHLKSYS